MMFCFRLLGFEFNRAKISVETHYSVIVRLYVLHCKYLSNRKAKLLFNIPNKVEQFCFSVAFLFAQFAKLNRNITMNFEKFYHVQHKTLFNIQ